MNTLEIKQIKCASVRIEADKFYVLLNDGREIGVPYAWFPRLAKATQVQRLNWRIIGKGAGLHWEDIDEDIAILPLLDPVASPDTKVVNVPAKILKEPVAVSERRAARLERLKYK